MKQFLSLDYLSSRSKESFLRFPLTIISGLVGVYVSIFMIECNDEIDNFFPLVNLLLVAALGVPLSIGSTIVTERSGNKIGLRIGSMFLSIVLMAAIYFSLPDEDITHNTTIPYIRYGLYNAIIHLLVSFAPFLGKKQLNGFWNFNKGLFIRMLLSVVYSGFITVGLFMALTALKVLFDVDVHWELYPEIFIVTGGLFNTWFFVAGIPKDLDHLDSVYEYPKGLKIFTQYVLLPLLGLYLVILYGYGSKILFAWDWPKGIVSYMITVVAVLGIFTVLLIYPYGYQKGNEWIKKFSKAYYFVLFPLIAILFIAIWLRVDDYGITINRYAILLLGVWLTIVAVYFAIGKGNIKFIPISLATILALVSFGPWGIFSVSEASQVSRLETILTENQILINGKLVNETEWRIEEDGKLISDSIISNENMLSDSLHNEVKSILDYLDTHHGFASIRHWYAQDIDALMVKQIEKDQYAEEARLYMTTMGLTFAHKYSDADNHHIGFGCDQGGVRDVGMYDQMYQFNFSDYGRFGQESHFDLNGDTFWLKFEHGALAVRSHQDTVNFDLGSFSLSLKNKYGNDYSLDLPQSKMMMFQSGDSFDFTLELESISMEYDKDSLSTVNVDGILFLTKK